MSKYNIPMNNLSIRLQKEQRVIKQLTHKDALIDALISLYNNAINQHSNQQENKNKFIELYKPIYHEINKSKLSLKDFQILHKDSFAEGAFGKVTVVKSTRNNQIYAMKTSSKSKLIDQMDRSSPMEERLILSNEDEEWLPSLYASFQDEKNLYLVMEYAPGGDLQGLLERRSFQPFNEQEAIFYCAELILAVERVHQLGYIHRDIKPGNILIDNKGHIKLGDLGSCISMDTKDYLLMVGTMPYVSPEMCNSEGLDPIHGPAYGSEVDWWSVGIVLYELLFGERPFIGSDIKIQMSLLNPKVSVQFDPNIKVSDEAKDLLSKLLCKSKDERLGFGGAAEIKSHPFFKNINWNLMRTTAIPPFIPSIVSPDDVTFFSATSNEDGNYEEEEDDDDSFVVADNEDQEDKLDKEYPFIGYTYLSYNNPASPTEKSVKTSSNQEFIAQLRHKLGSPEPKQWEDEKNRLKLAHEKELNQLKSEHIDQMSKYIKQNKTMQQEITDLKAENTQLDQVIQSLKEENNKLKSSPTEMEKLKAENSQALSSVQMLQIQLDEAKSENIKLSSKAGLQENQIKEMQLNCNKLQTTVQDLRIENEHLTKLTQENDASAQLQKNDLTFIADKCAAYEKQVEEYQNCISKLEINQRPNTEKQLLVQELQQEVEDLHVKLESEVRYSQDIKEEYNRKINNQANDHNNLIQQLKKENDTIKQELEEQRSTDVIVKRSIKSLPNIPTTTPAMNSPGEGRSILSTMLRRERDSLKNVQQALEDSENQLAYAKKQVIRLKREIKCFQKYTFQQQQQFSLSLRDHDDRNSDVNVLQLKNHSDHGRSYIANTTHAHKKPPLAIASIRSENNILPSAYSQESISFIGSSLSNPANAKHNTIGKTKQTNCSFDSNKKQNEALLHKIEQERSFINSTERTIAARARLSRNKGAIDKELEVSLMRAQSTLASLESSLSSKRYSPSDFFSSQKTSSNYH